MSTRYTRAKQHKPPFVIIDIRPIIISFTFFLEKYTALKKVPHVQYKNADREETSKHSLVHITSPTHFIHGDRGNKSIH